MKKQEEQQPEIVIDKVKMGKTPIWIKGVTPFIYHCVSAKVRRDLLFPGGKKTTADKAQKIKHDPIEEYRTSVYKHTDDNHPTRLMIPSTMPKAAICGAALEIPGLKKAQIGRLVWVCGDTIDMYGIPKLVMHVTRCSDMNHTPDISTKAILTEWCARFDVQFMMPTINETMVARLIETAGMVMGIGDFRPQKGKGNYGQFRLAEEKECAEIVKNGIRKAQDAALESQMPACYDLETRELLTWYLEERKRRGM